MAGFAGGWREKESGSELLFRVGSGTSDRVSGGGRAGFWGALSHLAGGRGALERGFELVDGFAEKVVDGRAGGRAQVVKDGHILRTELVGRPLVARWFAAIVCHRLDFCLA